ncbi:MAG TPA: chalcone isomerase family protein [Kofleriaceae bacterium]|nr:chalcone isomerase family protein [Kofleriaceae bacterium]
MRLTILLLSIATALAAPGRADAGKKAGVAMPDTLSVAHRTLVLNGMGLREATFLKIDVYVAGLYLEHVSSNPGRIVASDEVKRLVLRFVRDVDRDDILEAWHDGFQRNATVPLAMLKPQIAQLDAWMPGFDDGDTLVFTYVPGEGVTVEVNGARKGVLKGDDFARSLFSIWLGARPPTDELKRGLLGHHPEVP